MPETKRRVIGQMIVCQGCCCGATHKNRPPVPVEWLKTSGEGGACSSAFNSP
jgi:hypothetical protein